MRWRAPFVLFVLLGALGACGDDGKSGDADTTTTTVEPTTTTTGSTTTSAEEATTTTTTTCPAPVDPDPELARIDLDGDGDDEIWRSVGSGASTEIIELRHVEGCVEVPVLVDGLPAQFAVGGTVTHLDGVHCDGGDVVHLRATSEDGETYATVEQRYQLEGGALVLTGEEPGEADGADADLQDYATFTCDEGF